MMICPYCSNPIADNARFCGVCGRPLPAAEVQEPQAAAQAESVYVLQPKPRKWKPWMTVVTVILATLAGAAALWTLFISCVSGVTKQLIGTPMFDPAEVWTDQILPENTYQNQAKLMRSWSMTTSDSTGEAILWLTFDEDEVSLQLQSASGTEDCGAFGYAMVGENTFYIADFDQTFAFEINTGGNMLTISPGLVSNAQEEYWFNFS